MLSCYIPTELEKKIEKIYKERCILSPTDLNIFNVSKMFNVKINQSINGQPQRAIWDDYASVIFLDPSQSEEKQREVFFHELGHPLLHCGDQSKMKNKSFRELQEYQANQFQLYAALPFFMLKEMELPIYESQIINLIKNEFKVTRAFAKKRLEQIKSRILQFKIDNEIFRSRVARPKEQYEINEFTPQLEDLFSQQEITQYFPILARSNKKKVYINKFNEMFYTIEFNRGEIKWNEKFKLFPIDASIEIIQTDEFTLNEEDVPVLIAELFLHPSHPNDFAIDLNELKKKLNFYDVDPYNIRRFVISVQDLEQILQLDIVSNQLNKLSSSIPNGMF
jgi:Zn-dependent peptidase ImmA (M78 family)